MYYHYFNDSLKLALEMFGDYCNMGDDNETYHNKISKKVLAKDIKSIQKYMGSKIKKQNFLYQASTTIEPYYNMRVYTLGAKDKCSDDFKIDSLSKTLMYCKDSKLQQYIFLFQMDNKNKTNSLAGISNESSQIINTIKTDENYTRAIPKSAFTIANESFKSDTANYLASINSLKEISFNYKSDNDKWFYQQAAMTYNAFIQNNAEYNNLLSQFYLTRANPNKKLDALVSDSLAFNYIEQRSIDQQVVMINEQHWQSRHRLLGNLLLKYYYDQGFRYLAVEAIDKEDEIALNDRKYPLQSSGFYTRDPQFGNMIRSALRMGLEVVTYDYPGKNNREHDQALNIYNKTIAKDNDAKVLVWAGIQHIDESTSNSPKMAYYFKEISGIDPLTIEQTKGDFYIHLLTNTIAIDGDTINRKACDIFIFNNLKEDDYKIDPLKQDTVIIANLKVGIQEKLNQHKKLIMSVYYKSEFDQHRLNCVPLYNRLITDNLNVSLSLPKENDFTVIVRSPTGFILDEYNLHSY